MIKRQSSCSIVAAKMHEKRNFTLKKRLVNENFKPKLMNGRSVLKSSLIINNNIAIKVSQILD